MRAKIEGVWRTPLGQPGALKALDTTGLLFNARVEWRVIMQN
jgi:hypothetical protein